MDRRTLRNGLLTALVWASAFPGIRAALADYPPKELILLRFSVAALALFAMCFLRERRWPERRDLPRLAVLGLFSITFYQLPLNYGQLTVPSGTASLIINTAPLWATLFSRLGLGERLGKPQGVGVLLGFIGVVLITLGQDKTIGMGPGLALVFVAALSHSLSFILAKPLLEKYSPLTVTAFTVLFGVLPLAFWTPGLVGVMRQAPAASTLTVLYLGVFPAALAYMLWNRVVSALPVSRAASFLYLIPPFSLLIAWVWHREIPSGMSVMGGAIAIAGMMLVLRAGDATRRR